MNTACVSLAANPPAAMSERHYRPRRALRDVRETPGFAPMGYTAYRQSHTIDTRMVYRTKPVEKKEAPAAKRRPEGEIKKKEEEEAAMEVPKDIVVAEEESEAESSSGEESSSFDEEELRRLAALDDEGEAPAASEDEADEEGDLEDAQRERVRAEYEKRSRQSVSEMAGNPLIDGARDREREREMDGEGDGWLDDTLFARAGQTAVAQTGFENDCLRSERHQRLLRRFFQ
ncbi:pre-mRNA-splicing factor Cwf15/Cwc15 [Kipferlia bialata]|uniref:Pre-mRNA-splicing factor Cwf15/Cwc15 n=1 Tax=Kipferlia bialata TaxID=797122 RepID=A0A9K3GMW2_9EUKA|nr:pre-mRNA-splicing factor Cwf15/Cwc15 [Kipferlia bialata]|eukprot:g10360.t1